MSVVIIDILDKIPYYMGGFLRKSQIGDPTQVQINICIQTSLIDTIVGKDGKFIKRVQSGD